MILIENLSKEFEGHHVLIGLNLFIEKGETLVVMGRSGSGKSVLLKLIIGLMPPDEGKIFIDGIEITKLSEKQMGEVRKRFGMVFQSAALFDSLNVAENVGFSLSRHTDMSREQIAQVVSEKLQLVGLGGTEELMPSELSGGMRKRVSLARAISMGPEIILYDEPTTGLDPVTAGEINSLIAELHGNLKVTSIVVTHDLKSAFKVATRMAMLYEGKMVAIDTPDEFRKSTEPEIMQFLKNM
jgi:phospholipid/cholesterol/gamma-HCH transport system ATP-binding protein